MRIRLFMGFLLALATASSATLHAQFVQERLAKSLRGMATIAVFVSDLDADVMNDSGVNQDQLKTIVELRLRQAGIRVVPETPAKGSNGTAWVELNTHKLPSVGSYNYNLRLHVFRNINIVGGEQDTTANVWFTPPTMGIVSVSDVMKALREALTAQSDALANAYLSVNPKR